MSIGSLWSYSIAEFEIQARGFIDFTQIWNIGKYHVQDKQYSIDMREGSTKGIRDDFRLDMFLPL